MDTHICIPSVVGYVTIKIKVWRECQLPIPLASSSKRLQFKTKKIFKNEFILMYISSSTTPNSMARRSLWRGSSLNLSSFSDMVFVNFSEVRLNLL